MFTIYSNAYDYEILANRSEEATKNTKKNTGNGSFPRPLMVFPWGCTYLQELYVPGVLSQTGAPLASVCKSVVIRVM